MTDQAIRDELPTNGSLGKEREFLFLPCDGRAGHKSRDNKRLRNRHVQLDYRMKSTATRKQARLRDKPSNRGEQIAITRRFHVLEVKIEPLQTPAVWREAVHSRYFDLYTGTRASCGGYTFISQLTKCNKAAQLALDSLALVAIGSLKGGSGLAMVHEARKRYTQTLHYMQKTLNSHTLAQSPETILVPLHILRTCELFSGISIDSSKGWLSHTDGFLVVIMEYLKHQDDVVRLEAALQGIGDYLVPFCGWTTLITRSPEGRICAGAEFLSTNRKLQDGDADTGVYIVKAAAVLQRFERFSRDPPFDGILIAELTTSALLVEKHICAHMRSWPTSSAHLAVEGPASEQSLFPTMYPFKDLSTALRYLHCWLCLLALRQKEIDLWSNAGQNTDSLRRTAGLYADNVCICLQYLAQPSNGYAGAIHCLAPLEVVKRWFASQHDEGRLSWCRVLSEGLKAKGLIGELGV